MGDGQLAEMINDDDLRGESTLSSRGRAEPSPRLSVAGVRPALLLLASGSGFGGRLSPVRHQAVQRRKGHARQAGYGLYDAGFRRRANLDRRSASEGVSRGRDRMADGESSA